MMLKRGPERCASGELRNLLKLEKMKTIRLKCMFLGRESSVFGKSSKVSFPHYRRLTRTQMARRNWACDDLGRVEEGTTEK